MTYLRKACLQQWPVSSNTRKSPQTSANKSEKDELAPGASIPSEAELCRQYGCARGTIRQAVATLRNEGSSPLDKAVARACSILCRLRTSTTSFPFPSGATTPVSSQARKPSG
ncbi:GntR family transcriptional regulator [Corynebacterium camporealensis]|uniref:GntR family transcriptional regulator n=1 Tax=Corynebacterium camporealensis TaxID=161896 RepID=UPI0031FBAA82